MLFRQFLTFNPTNYWNEQRRAFEQMRETTFPFYPAVVCLTTAAFEILRHFVPQRYQPLEAPEQAGWVTLRVLFLSLHEARMHVLGLGRQVRVIEPAELQQTVLDTARAVAAMDESSGG